MAESDFQGLPSVACLQVHPGLRTQSCGEQFYKATSNGVYLPVSQPDDLGVNFKELEGNVKRVIFYVILQEYQSLLFHKGFEKSSAADN